MGDAKGSGSYCDEDDEDEDPEDDSDLEEAEGPLDVEQEDTTEASEVADNDEEDEDDEEEVTAPDNEDEQDVEQEDEETPDNDEDEQDVEQEDEEGPANEEDKQDVEQEDEETPENEEEEETPDNEEEEEETPDNEEEEEETPDNEEEEETPDNEDEEEPSEPEEEEPSEPVEEEEEPADEEDAETLVYIAELSGSNEVPPVENTVTGECKFIWSPGTVFSGITYYIQMSNPGMIPLLGALGAHLHCGSEDENGPVIATLVQTIEGGTTASDLSFSGVLADGSFADTTTACGSNIEELLQAMEDGNVYVNVHSIANPGGEVRGPIGRNEETDVIVYDVQLTGDAEVPPVTTTASGAATLIYTSGTFGISYFMTWLNPDGLELNGAVGTHIHCGAAGTNGPIIATLLSPTDGGLTAAQTQVAGVITDDSISETSCGDNVTAVLGSIEAGLVYINVHSTENPSGEVRGQVDPPNDIVSIALRSDILTILVQAVTRAGLTDALAGTGPLTVLAPSDEAFGNLPDGVLTLLLQPANVNLLIRLLQYHVIVGFVDSSTRGPLPVATLTGETFVFTEAGGTVTINGGEAIIQSGDILAENGNVLVIDTVLIPPGFLEELQPSEPAEELVDIVTLAQNTDFLSILVQAVVAADLTGALSGPGPFTVLAPNNDAFENLPDGVLDTLLEPSNQDLLIQVLQYHVLSGEVPFTARGALEFPTLSGFLFTFLEDNGVVSVNNGAADIVFGGIEALNGQVHVIDTVLIPPGLFEEGPVDIVSTASASDMLTILVQAITQAGLTSDLSGPGPLTVLAPSDEAFGNLPDGVSTLLLQPANMNLLIRLLQYHVIVGFVDSSTRGPLPAATLTGETFVFTEAGGTVTINGGEARVEAGDVLASNGIIHRIDTVLIPPGFLEELLPSEPTEELVDIVTLAQNTDILSTLVQAVVAADLVGALSEPGPFTVLAPTNQAFADLPPGTLDMLLMAENQNLLIQVLQHHVIAGSVDSSARGTLEFATLGGDVFSFSEARGTVTIDNGAADVVSADIMASNGIVHVIDTVLIPPGFGQESEGNTIIDVAEADGRFGIVLSAIETAGLTSVLRSSGPYTFFAPTDAAFAQLGPEADAFLSDVDTLVTILTNHVLDYELLKSEISQLDDSAVRTMSGYYLTMIQNDDTNIVKIDDEAHITTPDIRCSNGVIHVIDSVLAPPEATPCTSIWVVCWVKSFYTNLF